MKNTAKIDKKAEIPVKPFVHKAPDAIMAEVWRIKAQINAEAGYSVENILERARQCALHQASVRIAPDGLSLN
jgi:hypothetical protein